MAMHNSARMKGAFELCGVKRPASGWGRTIPENEDQVHEGEQPSGHQTWTAEDADNKDVPVDSLKVFRFASISEENKADSGYLPPPNCLLDECSLFYVICMTQSRPNVRFRLWPQQFNPRGDVLVDRGRFGHPPVITAYYWNSVLDKNIPIDSYYLKYKRSCIMRGSHKDPFSNDSVLRSEDRISMFRSVWRSIRSGSVTESPWSFGMAKCNNVPDFQDKTVISLAMNYRELWTNDDDSNWAKNLGSIQCYDDVVEARMMGRLRTTTSNSSASVATTAIDRRTFDANNDDSTLSIGGSITTSLLSSDVTDLPDPDDGNLTTITSSHPITFPPSTTLSTPTSLLGAEDQQSASESSRDAEAQAAKTGDKVDLGWSKIFSLQDVSEVPIGPDTYQPVPDQHDVFCGSSECLPSLHGERAQSPTDQFIESSSSPLSTPRLLFAPKTALSLDPTPRSQTISLSTADKLANVPAPKQRNSVMASPAGNLKRAASPGGDSISSKKVSTTPRRMSNKHMTDMAEAMTHPLELAEDDQPAWTANAEKMHTARMKKVDQTKQQATRSGRRIFNAFTNLKQEVHEALNDLEKSMDVLNETNEAYKHTTTDQPILVAAKNLNGGLPGLYNSGHTELADQLKAFVDEFLKANQHMLMQPKPDIGASDPHLREWKRNLDDLGRKLEELATPLLKVQNLSEPVEQTQDQVAELLMSSVKEATPSDDDEPFVFSKTVKQKKT